MSDLIPMLESALSDRVLDKIFYTVVVVAAAVLGLLAIAAFILVPGARLMAGLILTAVIVYGGKKAGLEDKYVMVISLAVLLVTVMSVYTGALTLVEIP